MMTFVALVKCTWSRDDDCKHHGMECLLGETKSLERQTHFGLVERKEKGRAALALGRRGGEQRCAQIL